MNGLSTPFVWNEDETLPELLEAGETSYLYGPESQPIEEITGSTATFLHQDQQGSVRLLTDAAGTAVGRYDYTAWGQVTKHSGSAMSSLQYDGQYTDMETSFQYLRARYYDPATGQFLTLDPAADQTRQRYTYANNAPVSFTDPHGLFAVGTCVSVTGTVVGGGGAQGSGVVCSWTGYFPSFTATTISGSAAVGLGLEGGVSGQAHIVYSSATGPKDLAGLDCSVGASGQLIVGAGVSAGGCSGAFSLDVSLDLGVEGGASVTGGITQTCVISSSTGYRGCGNSDGVVSTEPVCNDQAYKPYGNIG